MYGKTGVVAVTGGLAATGFGLAWYVVLASALLVSGLLLARWGRRRGASS
jgi:hypothetical protein